jgi:integrase
MRAHRRQDGHLQKRFGGWHLRYYATENGIRKSKSHRLCADHEKMSVVKQLREDFMRTRVNIGVENSGPVCVAEFWEKTYLPFIESNDNLKPSTVYGYRQVWNKHLKAHFGTLQFSDYKTHMMTNFLTDLARTLRQSTLNTIQWLASAIFAHAVATGACETNPIRDAKVLGKTIPKGITKSYSLEEIENVISALVDNSTAQLIVALTYFAGMRKGEIGALQWLDIDENCIHVRRAFSRGVLGEPKSKKSVRSIPLIQPVRGLLMLQRAKCGNGVLPLQSWVFSNTKGAALNLDNFALAVIQPALRKAGCEWTGFHAGRRGLGKKLKALTLNSTAGRDVFGHATTKVTEGHYEERPSEVASEDALRGMKLLEAEVTSGKKDK